MSIIRTAFADGSPGGTKTIASHLYKIKHNPPQPSQCSVSAACAFKNAVLCNGCVTSGYQELLLKAVQLNSSRTNNYISNISKSDWRLSENTTTFGSSPVTRHAREVYCPLLLPHRCQFVSSKKKRVAFRTTQPRCACVLRRVSPFGKPAGRPERGHVPRLAEAWRKIEVFLLHTRASVVLALVIMIIIRESERVEEKHARRR